MFYFKACVKCKGDMYEERDAFGAYVQCVQCGRIVDLEPRQEVSDKPEGRVNRKLAA